MGSESGGEDTSPEKVNGPSFFEFSSHSLQQNDSMGFPPVPELPLLGSGKPRSRGDSVGHRSSFSDNEVNHVAVRFWGLVSSFCSHHASSRPLQTPVLRGQVALPL